MRFGMILIALAFSLFSGAALCDWPAPVRLVVVHPSDKSRNIITYHDRLSVASGKIEDWSGVVLQSHGDSHTTTASNRRYHTRGAAVKMNENGHTTVRIWLPSHIRTLDFETCATGFAPCVPTEF